MATTSSKKFFHWTEGETALLLKVIFEYKAAKSTAAQDWETIHSKHDDLLKQFIEAYFHLTTDEFTRGEAKETFTAARV